MKENQIEMLFPDAVYLDLNIFREIGLGNVLVPEDSRVTWVFSATHFEELARNGSEKALKQTVTGIAKVGARKLAIEPSGKGVISGFEGENMLIDRVRSSKDSTGDAVARSLLVPLSRLLGGASTEEAESSMRQAMNQLQKYIDSLPREVKEFAQQSINIPALESSQNEMLELLSSTQKPKNIDEIRNGIGLTNIVRCNAEHMGNPHEYIFEELSNVSEEFARGMLSTDSSHVPWSNEEPSAFEKLHTYYFQLAVMGVNAEPKLNQEDTLNRVMSDAAHVQVASACGTLVTADRRMADKAEKTYSAFNVSTRVLHLTSELIKSKAVLKVESIAPEAI